jgi:hypothetical protein
MTPFAVDASSSPPPCAISLGLSPSARRRLFASSAIPSGEQTFPGYLSNLRITCIDSSMIKVKCQ